MREAVHEHNLKCDLTVVRDGEKAIALLDEIQSEGQSCPDLVVLDLNLPKRTGLEVLRHLRSGGACRDIPVVILSSSDAPEDRRAALSLGANLYIRKPSNLEEFLKVGATFKSLLNDKK